MPSAEDQLVFLSKLQRLFAEGDFTATYKYALLIAMADLAIEVSDDRLTHQALAAKFIELYWQQSAPYGTGRGEPAVLVQNTGNQATVVSAIVSFRNAQPSATVQSAPNLRGYRELIKKVARKVDEQPVTCLQNFGDVTDPFLYEREHDAIVLRPGVADCLRRFQPLVQQLARSHWVAHIKGNKRNVPILGNQDDLESFLFETPRQALTIIGNGLRGLTNNKCFYCAGTVREAEVDHFVPFSLYPRDLAHNFVLAHKTCNGSKSDALAARSHLERWVQFIDHHDADIKEIGQAAGRIADVSTSLSVAHWGYKNAADVGAMAWVKKGHYEAVDRGYLECLG